DLVDEIPEMAAAAIHGLIGSGPELAAVDALAGERRNECVVDPPAPARRPHGREAVGVASLYQRLGVAIATLLAQVCPEARSSSGARLGPPVAATFGPSMPSAR